MTQTLDEWFAQADDVLANWHGGTDAMHGHAPEDEDAAPLPAPVDSYYDQGGDQHEAFVAMTHAFLLSMEPLRLAFVRVTESLTQLRLPNPLSGYTGKTVDVRERALQARRDRNTGPTSRLGLDGHHR